MPHPKWAKDKETFWQKIDLHITKLQNYCQLRHYLKEKSLYLNKKKCNLGVAAGC